MTLPFMMLAAIVAATASLVRTKIVALNLGPEGIATYGILITGLGMVATVVTMNLGVGIAKKIIDEKQNRLVQCLIIARSYRLAALMMVLGLPFAFTSFFLSSAVVQTSASNSLLIAASIGSLLAVAGNIFLSICQGTNRFQLYSRTQIIAAILSVIFTFLAVGGNSDFLLVTAITAFPLFFAAAFIPTIRADLYRNKSPINTEGINLFRTLFMSGVYLTFAGFWQQGFLFGARLAIFKLSSAAEAGVILAAWMAVFSIITLIIVPLAKFQMPRIRQAVGLSSNDFAIQIRLRFYVIFGIGLLACIALYWGADLIIRLLYSSAFEKAAYILRALIAAEFLRLINSFFSSLLVAKGLEKKQLAMDSFVYGISILLFVVLLVQGMNIPVALALAMLVGQCCGTVFVYLSVVAKDDLLPVSDIGFVAIAALALLVISQREGATIEAMVFSVILLFFFGIQIKRIGLTAEIKELIK